MDNPPINIYLRPEEATEGFPESLYDDMSVIQSFRSEIQWLFYLMLKDRFVKTEICRTYPESGIMFIHKANVDRFYWKPNLLVVSMQWDYSRDDRAQVHLVSNHFQATKASLGLLDRLSCAGLQCVAADVLHPVIIPRDPKRGDLFENIVFMGEPKNLDDAFKSDFFLSEISKLGMKFIIIDDPKLHPDFSQVDAVLAIRVLEKVIVNKPAAKLINAWRGGVPAVLGCEQGYREKGENGRDYIEVDSIDEVLDALKRLKTDIKYRTQMIDHAKRRGAEFTLTEQQRTLAQFVNEHIIPAYTRWMRMSLLGKYAFLTVRWVRYKIRRALSFLRHRVLKVSAKHFRH